MKRITTLFLSMALLLPLAAQVGPAPEDDADISYKIEKLPFNSKDADFAPVIHGNQVVFCKNKMPDYWSSANTMRGNTDIYFTEKDNATGNYIKPEKLKGDVNSNGQEGPFCIADNGKTIYYTKARKLPDKEPMWFIYIANKSYDKWDDIVGFYHNYKQYNIAHPTLSENGQYLFFSADIPGGHGGMDLYWCYKTGNTWSKPVNLGSNINSPQDEIFPFFYSDGTLYFASNGLNGNGGFDIFYTRKNENKGWGQPINMPSPINSAQDDLGFALNSDKTYGYLSSTRGGGAGSCDIYGFTVNEQGAAGLYADMGTKINTSKANLPKATLPAPPQQPITPRLFDASKFDPQIGLLNDALGLGRIAFEAGDWHLLSQTHHNIDQVVELMNQNPSLMVQINAHTDTRGDEEENRILSEKRAKEVERYLINMGIQSERLSSYGLGEKMPINRCLNGMNCPDGEHDINNRIEFIKAGGQIAEQNPFVFSSQKAPITGNKSVAVSAHAKAYEVRVGPFDKVDARTFYDYRNINQNIYLEETPKGKTVVLGPYSNYEAANYERVRVQEKTAQKANVTVSTTQVAPLISAKDATTKFEVYVGPFHNNINADLFNKFRTFNSSAALRYIPKGTMIVCGKYDNLSEALEQELAMREFLKAQFTKKAAKKINTAVFTNSGKTLTSGWLNLHKTRPTK